MASAYLWLKTAHILAVIAWMAAMLYLPRLMVYHADAAVGSDKSETFKVMERRLLRGIMTPSMIASWVFGLAVVTVGGFWSSGWLHAKLALVIAMTVIHGLCARWVRAFAEDRNLHSGRYYRIMNEVPALLLVVIVGLVVLKPF
ncbi:protoporphyrinogen oxidase HemJ [Amorphus orientalis]|uniref:Protoporphyrinogen IX oxidase n=1 Tax=Amorphus orientalis TaxID=649198 RepID=A0AAE3VKJ9_9HYPH|nr:protoporphyrinogen oxidase HemJ [Amorphus orientalis]MDQ0313730.1 putative membrane protein [Amorphus orientalis]